MTIQITLDRRSVPDEAWDVDDHKTNYRLRDGDIVALTKATRGECSRGYASIPAGAKGVVKHARTPRVTSPTGHGYFANIDIDLDGTWFRVRVPHNAVKKLARKSASISV